MNGTIAGGEAYKELINCRFKKLQVYCRAKKQERKGNVVEVSTMATELDEGPVASASEVLKGDAIDSRATMADAVKKIVER